MPSWGRNGEASERLVEPHRFQPTPFQIRRQFRKTLEFLTPLPSLLISLPPSFLPPGRHLSASWQLALVSSAEVSHVARSPLLCQPASRRFRGFKEGGRKGTSAQYVKLWGRRDRGEREGEPFAVGALFAPHGPQPRCPRGWLERVSNAGRRMIQHQFRFRFSGRQSSHAETKAFRALGSQ